MTATSHYLASVSRSAKAEVRNSGECPVRDAIAICYAGRVDRAPLTAGSDPSDLRYRRMKIAGTRGLTIDDFANVVADRDGSNAVPLIRALAVKAGVDDRLVIKASATSLPAPTSLAEAELALSRNFAEYISAVESRHVERKRLLELEQGIEARAMCVLRALDHDGVDQS